MGIVSYAQNFEDVMLWRALKNVNNGFYIDVGANHPTIDSVTKAFYENGWHGVNIEPELELYELLNKQRERDINLNMAISASVTSIEFYVSSVRGWSTTDQESSTNLKDKDSFSEIRTVRAISLDKLCENNNIDEVHFLKIDVEGAEKDVLESFSFDKVRPWICVVEATKPTTQIDVSDEWEDIILSKNYEFAYFDGLNKYYVAKEHLNLLDVLKIPPNVFDEFMISNHRDAIIKMDEAEAKANEAEVKASEAEVRTNEALHHYHMVVTSNSWKIMKPFRLARKAVRWFMTGAKHWLTFSPTSRPRRVLKETLVSLKHRINSNPKLKMRVIRIFNHFPGLKARLKKVGQVQYNPTESFISKYQFEQSSPRTDNISNQNNIQNLSVDEILQRIESEVQKQGNEDTKR